LAARSALDCASIAALFPIARHGTLCAPSTSFGRAQRFGLRPDSGAFPNIAPYTVDFGSSALTLKITSMRDLVLNIRLAQEVDIPRLNPTPDGVGLPVVRMTRAIAAAAEHPK